MKKFSTLLIYLIFGFAGFSQSKNQVFGKYEQLSYIAPDDVKDSENDIEIIRDQKATKKIIIKNLLVGGDVTAVLFVAGNSDNKTSIYKINAQLIGNYQIKLGCAVFDEEGQLTIALNNKSMCYGFTADDYKNIKISKNGEVEAGNTKIGRKGVKTSGVDINNNAISVDGSIVMAGVQYVGNKIGFKSEE